MKEIYPPLSWYEILILIKHKKVITVTIVFRTFIENWWLTNLIKRVTVFFNCDNSAIEYKIPSVQSGYYANKSRLLSAVKRGGVILELFWFADSIKMFFSRTWSTSYWIFIASMHWLIIPSYKFSTSFKSKNKYIVKCNRTNINAGNTSGFRGEMFWKL